MASLRYVGSASWDRVILDDEGKFKELKKYYTGDVVEDLSDEQVEALANPATPRHFRTFVEVGGSEDPESDKFTPGPYEAVGGNASAYPKLDMGSTVTGDGAPQFLTPEDGGTDRGTPSDNAELVAIDEVEAKAEEARKEVRASQKRSASRPPAGAPSETESS